MMEQWSSLPTDILVIILSVLKRHELQHIRLVNCRWRAAVDTAVSAIRVSSKAVQSMGSIVNVASVITQHFPNLRSLDLMGIPDHNIEMFMTISGLTELDLKGPQLTDAGLKALSPLHMLGTLNLWDTSVGSEGMKYIQDLSSLSSLDLAWAQVQDDGIKYLTSLPKLTSLNLWATVITDRGLEYLGEMKTLLSLDMTETKITDNGVQNLARLSNITSLDFSFTCIGNDSVRSIVGLKKLRFLGLRGTQVTDRFLEYIGAFTSLTSLNIEKTVIGADYAICPEHYLEHFSNLNMLFEILY